MTGMGQERHGATAAGMAPPGAGPAATAPGGPARGGRGRGGAGRIVAIASGKGGVGKTWLAVSLAQALGEAGAGPVLLVDADHGLANVDVQLGLNPTLDLAAVLAGRVALAAAAVPHPAGFAVLPGRSGSGAVLDAAAVERLIGLLDEAARRWPLVLVDCAAGLGAAERRVTAAADTVLVVATDEPTSLTDAYAVLKLHRHDCGAAPADARVVVNQAADAVAGQRTWRSLDRACAGFLGAGVPLAGVIRRDPRVPDAIRRQAPLLSRHPQAPAAADVRRLARGVLALPGGALPA
jgi:flagellar biosynthesis protein FlhG